MVIETSQLEQMLINAEGEITEEIQQALVIKDTHLPAKIDAYHFVLERMDHLQAFYRQKAEFFLKLAQAADRVTEALETNIKISMELAHTDELVGIDHRFKLQKSPPRVAIDDEDLVDDAYKITKVTTTIDKKAIADDIKKGCPVPGAHLEQGHSLRKFANSPARRKVAE